MDAEGGRERAEVQTDVTGITVVWLTSRLFRSYLCGFLLLWITGKIANAVTTALLKLPLLAFRPGTEIVVLAFELAVLVAVIRRANLFYDPDRPWLALSLTAADAPPTACSAWSRAPRAWWRGFASARYSEWYHAWPC